MESRFQPPRSQIVLALHNAVDETAFPEVLGTLVQVLSLMGIHHTLSLDSATLMSSVTG